MTGHKTPSYLLTSFLGGNASWSSSFTGAQVDQELCCALCCNCDRHHRCVFTPGIRHGAFTAEPFTSKGLSSLLLSALGQLLVDHWPLVLGCQPQLSVGVQLMYMQNRLRQGFDFSSVCWSKRVPHVAPARATEFFLYFSFQLLCCGFQLKSSFLSLLVVAIPFLTSFCIFAVNHG